jgi:hypothetical protein
LICVADEVVSLPHLQHPERLGELRCGADYTGVQIDGGTVSISSNANIHGNTTGIQLGGGSVSITSSVVHDNSARNIGNFGGTLSVSNSEIASSSVRGVYQGSGSSIVTLSDIHDNGHGLEITGGTMNVSRSLVHDQNRGLSISGGTLVVAGSEIHDNNYGIYVTGGSVSATSNLFKANSVFGVYSSSPSVDAPYNYWDDDSGPHNSSNNPLGTGNEVSDPVGFTPWNTHDHYLAGFSSVFSAGLLQWDGSTTYTTAWTSAIDTWNAEGQINIIPTETEVDLTVYDVTVTSASWLGEYHGYLGILPGDIELNQWFLDVTTPDVRQSTVLHELGHALGLAHSYVGNTMSEGGDDHDYSQTSIGTQDWRDYHYLWGY